MSRQYIFFGVLVAVIMTAVVGSAVFFSTPRSVARFLGEVEAVSFDSNSMVVKDRSNAQFVVIARAKVLVLDEGGMAVAFKEIKPGSVVKLSGTIEFDARIITADVIEIGARPSIVVYAPMSGDTIPRTAEHFSIVGEARLLNAELFFRATNKQGKVVLKKSVDYSKEGGYQFQEFSLVLKKDELVRMRGLLADHWEVYSVTKDTPEENTVAVDISFE